MKIEFDPQTVDGKKQVEEFSRKVAKFVQRSYPELAGYDLLELNFYWPKPETETKPIEVQREFSVKKLMAK